MQIDPNVAIIYASETNAILRILWGILSLMFVGLGLSLFFNIRQHLVTRDLEKENARLKKGTLAIAKEAEVRVTKAEKEQRRYRALLDKTEKALRDAKTTNDLHEISQAYSKGRTPNDPGTSSTD